MLRAGCAQGLWLKCLKLKQRREANSDQHSAVNYKGEDRKQNTVNSIEKKNRTTKQSRKHPSGISKTTAFHGAGESAKTRKGRSVIEQ
jgi:hypothetical protein